MAAVAREPGAAAVPTVSVPEPRAPDPACSGPGLPPVSPESPGARLCPALSDKDEDRRHVPAATVSSEANAKANANAELQTSPRAEPELPPPLRDSSAGKPLSDPGPGTEQDPVQSAVSPLSLPAGPEAPEAPEAGLSLGQPNGPDRACTERTLTQDRACTERTLTQDRACTERTLTQDRACTERTLTQDRACTERTLTQDRTQRTLTQSPERTELAAARFTALRERAEEDTGEDRGEDPGPHAAHDPPEPPDLRPGTHVRVSLDHVIDDALVVSFRVGHKVFSGVLMDLSRRFGPYGIPITAFPARRESSRRHVSAPPPAADAPPPPAAEGPPPDPSATPLFHQGAPYPPPLFLRDTYHQSLPQPPPRRIKRSRRRYGNSEEPTCMLVRLRPRQVLCDRCKGTAGPRPAPSTRRRPNPEPLDENLPTEVKRLRCDDARPSRPRRDAARDAPRDAPRDRTRDTPRDTPRAAPGGGANATNPAPRRHNTNPRDARSREPTRSSLRSAPGALRTTAGLRSRTGSGLRSESGLRSNPTSGSSAGTRVLTRRISSTLSPPRIRLKPHRAELNTMHRTVTGRS